MFWVYILQCNDNSYYTGHTDNLEARLYQHYNKTFPTCYTATRLPLKLAYSEQYPSRIEALQAEKQIQGWSRKKKKHLSLVIGNNYPAWLVEIKNSFYVFCARSNPSRRVLRTLLRANGLGKNG